MNSNQSEPRLNITAISVPSETAEALREIALVDGSIAVHMPHLKAWDGSQVTQGTRMALYPYAFRCGEVPTTSNLIL